MDIQHRLQYLEIDENTTRILPQALDSIGSNVEGVLDRFYSKIAATPHLAAFFTPETKQHARSMQLKHWTESVFSGKFDDTYMARVQRIGHTHEKIGLEPQWYMGGYCFALTQLIRLVMEANRKRPERAAEQIEALVKAVFLDMELGVSVYIEASKETARQTLSNHADRFDMDVKGMVQLVASAAVELQAISDAMAQTAHLTAEQTTEVAANAASTSQNVETVAAATTELSASIEEIGRQAAAVRQSTSDAVEDANQVRAVVSQLSEAVSEIAAATREVTDISNRTRLLALNATIESARAGEHGKGFAVVAGEVKSLADQASRVTENIIKRIQAVESATNLAMTSVDRVSQVIDRLHGVSSAIASAVEEQGAATQEIARSVGLAANSSHNITTVIGTVAQAAHETGSSAHNVRSSSSELSVNADQLSRKVDNFLSELKVA
ncbi:MAG TPA: globin-coupled sensor protein [Candidatus Sulfotelmatobacter sp.]|jgi:methyl-accepting chemotaxis protein|nr:globin-coupled sensor protein [Candidatus Sulfotelmatobacter sp.]